MGIRRGQPKTSLFVRYNIAYKVIQYEKAWKITPYKAWLLLTKKNGFEDLMREHFKNKSGSADWWIKNMKSPNTKKNFYKNHPIKFRKELIDYRLTQGLGSLKKPTKKTK